MGKTYSLSLLLAMSTTAFVAATVPARAAEPQIEGCLVKLDDDVKLGAKEPGVLVQLNVREGSSVRKGEVLGRIDDREAAIKEDAAKWALAAAIKTAKDDVQQRYAEVTAQVKEKGYQILLEANRTESKVVPQTEVDEKYLEWKAAMLSAEKAKLDQELAKYEAQGKQAEYNAAKLGLANREIVAEFDGVVVKLYRQQGEWVGPGDPILRLVRLDKMLVEGAVDLAAYDPHELQNCEVIVDVELARGRKEQLNGRIAFVSPMVRLDGKYIVRAEVNNREEYGQWLLRDGMTANMTIHLNTGGATPVGVSRTP